MGCAPPTEAALFADGAMVAGLVGSDELTATLDGPSGALVLETHPTPEAQHRMFAFQLEPGDDHAYQLLND
jgi:hypothetical protein